MINTGRTTRRAGRTSSFVNIFVAVYFALVGVAFVAVIMGGYVFDWQWVGVANKTWWDWLSLLLEPALAAAVAFVGTRLSTLQYIGQQEAEERRAQDAALQGYRDQIAQLLIAGIRKSQRDDEVREVARLQTLMILRGLRPEHKRSVVEFLYEADLIKKERETASGSIKKVWPIIDLHSADLSSARLHSIVLCSADFSGANLSGANLSGADLSGADLTDAKVTAEQLATCESLKGATMPNGQQYEDWLKSRGKHSGHS